MASRIAANFARPEPTPNKRPDKRKTYISWLHTLPCAVTGCNGIEASHVSFANGWYGHYGRARGTKAPDLFAIPLSVAEHARAHSMNEQVYWALVGIDPHLLGLTLWGIFSNYDEHEATERASARIMAGLNRRDA